MRARCQPMRDRLNPFAVFLLTARSPWLAGRSQAQHMPEPAILLGSHPWPPTLRTSVPDRGQPEASIRRASYAVPIIRTDGDTALLRAVEHLASCGWCQPKPRRGAL